MKIADTLARRPDTSCISLCSGGTEIVASAYGDSIDSLLFEASPRTRSVINVHAHEVLYVSTAAPASPC